MRKAKIFDFEQYIDANERYTRDFSAMADKRSTTVSTAVASSTGLVELTIASESLDTDTGIWAGRVTGATASHRDRTGQIMISITFADGDFDFRFFDICILDPRLTKD